MSDSRKQAMAILARVSEFLARLPEDQLDAIALGEARLTLIPAGSDEPLMLPGPARTARVPKERVATPGARETAESLRTIESREAAALALKPLGVPALKDVAAEFGLTVPAKATKDKLILLIVEGTVGNRLDVVAIRGTATLPY